MPKKMNLGNLIYYDTSKIIAELQRLDAALTGPASIQLCGSASVLLQGINFRQTMNIDFAILPDSTVLQTINTVWQNKHLFDVNATGIIGLLLDYDERLVEMLLGLKHLRVYCLSTRDWTVSKLASPKVDDVLARDDISLDDLLWVQEHMGDYCGVSIDRAHRDLSVLIKEFGR